MFYVEKLIMFNGAESQCVVATFATREEASTYAEKQAEDDRAASVDAFVTYLVTKDAPGHNGEGDIIAVERH